MPHFFSISIKAHQRHNIHSNECVCYYERSKVGPVPIGNTLPELSEILEIPRITNGQIRPTSIRKMTRAGIEDRVIMELTGHTRLENLKFYDPVPENEVKIQRSVAILGGKKTHLHLVQ